MISQKRGIFWYIFVFGLLAVLFALDVNRYIAGLIVQVLLLGFAIAPVLLGRENKEALGLVKIRWRVGVLAFLITAAVAFAFLWLTGGELILPKLDVRLLFTIVLAPVIEELFFRGYLQPVTEVETGKWLGLVIIALLFMVAHLPKILILQEDSPLFLIVLFVLGMGYGIIKDRTGSVYNTMLSHGGWNVVSVFFMSV